MRKKILSLTFIIAFALCIVLFFYNKKENFNDPLQCDLNLQDCFYKFKDKDVLISLNPKPLQALEITHLKIKNLGSYQNLKMKIYGLNMFMGEIKPKLIKLQNGDYESKIVLSACVLDTMRFRAEFTDGDKPIGFYFDFELKR